jgi:hypothetical protein
VIREHAAAMERARPARGAVDGDVAAHESCETAGDIEPKAGAAGLARIDALEAVEYPLLIFLGDALALVRNDDRGKVPFPLGAQPDLAALGRIADRVGDQVHHDLEAHA